MIMKEGDSTTSRPGSNKQGQASGTNARRRHATSKSLRRVLAIVVYATSALFITLFVYLFISISKLDPDEDEVLYRIVYGGKALENMRYSTAASHKDHAYCFDDKVTEVSADGFCRYSTRGGDPLLILAPSKDEVFSRSPPIVLIHDALSDGDVEMVYRMADHKFRPSEVVSDNGTVRLDKEVRFADVAWVGLNEVRRITRRVRSLTGMTMLHAEMYQFGRYEPGGHYLPHCDGLIDRKNVVPQGVRISTFLVYLNTKEPGEGGHTVFPNMKLSFRPQKGSALMWYSMFPNGSQTCDVRTEHSACPVASGRKWIINVWNHMFGEEFTRPCPLDRYADYTLESMDGNFKKFIYGDEERFKTWIPADMPNVDWPDIMENTEGVSSKHE